MVVFREELTRRSTTRVHSGDCRIMPGPLTVERDLIFHFMVP